MNKLEIFEKHVGLNAELGYLPIKKEDVLEAMQEYADQEHLRLIRFFKNYPGTTKHLTPEFILNQFKKEKTNHQ